MNLQKSIMKSGFVGFLIGVGVTTTATFFLYKNDLLISAQKVAVPETREIITEKIIEKCPPAPEVVLLPPPAFTENVPEVLKTNNEGEVRILWSTVDNAKKYQINLIAEDGKKIKTWKTSKQSLYLTDMRVDEKLDFTPYKITLQTLNENDELGPESSPKRLLVRRFRTIVAPTIKSISVED